MALVVQKFGGSSVAGVQRIKEVAKIINRTYLEGNQCVVVVSAMGDYTDEMLDLAKQLNGNPPQRELDMLLTTGEQASIALLAMAMNDLDRQAISFTGWQAGIKTEAVHGKARILDINTDRIFSELNKGKIVLVAGFQGISSGGEITTLGRGGSDTSAVALAAALNADVCEIYTDVEGVYTTDPRVVPDASKLDEISYDEMLELANLGAVVLHPRAVETAKHHRVKLVVRSSFKNSPGTEIKEESAMENVKVVAGVAFDLDVARIRVIGLNYKVDTLSNLFTKLGERKLNVDMIVSSDYENEKINVAFSTTMADLDEALKILSIELEPQVKIIYDTNLAKVSIVGAGMISNPGVAAKMFQTLSDRNIPIRMVSTSEIKVSCLVPKELAKDAVRVLHEAFGLNTESLAETVAANSLYQVE